MVRSTNYEIIIPLSHQIILINTESTKCREKNCLNNYKLLTMHLSLKNVLIKNDLKTNKNVLL